MVDLPSLRELIFPLPWRSPCLIHQILPKAVDPRFLSGRQVFLTLTEQQIGKPWIITLWGNIHRPWKPPCICWNKSSNPYLPGSMLLYQRVRWINHEPISGNDLSFSTRNLRPWSYLSVKSENKFSIGDCICGWSASTLAIQRWPTWYRSNHCINVSMKHTETPIERVNGSE